MEALTVKQAAEAIGVSEPMVRRYVASGQLKAERFGHIWRIPASAVASFERPEMGRPVKKRKRRRG